jgi:STE24 endopeptidase
VPFGFIFLEHSRAWGLTDRSVGDWLRQRCLSLAVYGGIQALVVTGFYVLMRCLPRTWWLACSLASPLLAIAGTIIQPLFLAPLFNTFTPLEESEWKYLKPRVEDLLHQAGVNVADVLVVDASRQSGHTNAYFTGFGDARRIVLYDTLLKEHINSKTHDTAEVESILAHELGHWLHDDIVHGIILGSIASFFGFLLLFLFLNWMRGRAPCYMKSAADPAGLPLIILVAMLAQWVIEPVANVYSRYIERRADQASLELAGRPDAFIAAERRMALKNISRLDPHPLQVFLRNSHPPVVDRIQMALDWKKTRHDK